MSVVAGSGRASIWARARSAGSALALLATGQRVDVLASGTASTNSFRPTRSACGNPTARRPAAPFGGTSGRPDQWKLYGSLSRPGRARSDPQTHGRPPGHDGETLIRPAVARSGAQMVRKGSPVRVRRWALRNPSIYGFVAPPSTPYSPRATIRIPASTNSHLVTIPLSQALRRVPPRSQGRAPGSWGDVLIAAGDRTIGA
jgi:hypothetical protein